MKNSYLSDMMALAIRAGKMSLAMMAKRQVKLKPDQSVLTSADTAVSKLIRQGLAKYLQIPGHALLDEEDAASAQVFAKLKEKEIEYLWVADPIDGTRNYANRMPMYGVSLGIIRQGKPWLGVIYFPMLDEMFYCDGKKSYFVKKASGTRPLRQMIKPVSQSITKLSIYYGSDTFFKNFNWDFSLCQIMLPSCAVLDLCWPAVGRGVGSFFNAHLWDFAGAWPIFQSADLNLRELNSGRKLEKLDLNLFQGHESRLWKLKDYYVLSTEDHFPIIRQAIIPRALANSDVTGRPAKIN